MRLEDQLIGNGIPEESVSYLAAKIRAAERYFREIETKDRPKSTKRNHWANHTGVYKDPEFMKFPKFYHTRKRVTDTSSVRNYQEFLEAVEQIQSGEKRYDKYKGINGIYNLRLRLAQSLTDKRIEFSAQILAKLSVEGLREAMRQKPRYGSKYGSQKD